jgi:hypothetical protein
MKINYRSNALRVTLPGIVILVAVFCILGCAGKDADLPPIGADPPPTNVTLYDSGPFVTHLGGGYNGADASTVQTSLSLSTYGFNCNSALYYKLADAFTVTDAGGWYISQVTFYAYQSNASTSPSTFTDCYVQI